MNIRTTHTIVYHKYLKIIININKSVENTHLTIITWIQYDYSCIRTRQNSTILKLGISMLPQWQSAFSRMIGRLIPGRTRPEHLFNVVAGNVDHRSTTNADHANWKPSLRLQNRWRSVIRLDGPPKQIDSILTLSIQLTDTMESDTIGITNQGSIRKAISHYYNKQ